MENKYSSLFFDFYNAINDALTAHGKMVTMPRELADKEAVREDARVKKVKAFGLYNSLLSELQLLEGQSKKDGENAI